MAKSQAISELQRKHQDENRVSALGMWGYANDFLRAANKIIPNPGSQFHDDWAGDCFPVFFLVAHSIELGLKSYLLALGVQPETLMKPPYGHNLTCLLEECRRRKIGRFVKFKPYHLEIIALMHSANRNMNLRYFRRGLKILPKYTLAHQTAEILVNGLKDYCVRQTLREANKGRRT